MGLIDMKGIVAGVGQIADDLFTSDEELALAELKLHEIDASLAKGQMEVNKEEAKHKSLFVAGARPAAIWVCVIGLAYQFLIYPLLGWLWVYLQARGTIPSGLEQPPALDITQILSLLGGLLGLGAYRSYDKRHRTQTDILKPGKGGGWFGRGE
uniref:Holin of 3TMs, for gene-transfer release n=1 Tax=Candidatus Kentrum sp. DK TaxID=2126562 RepID=A0A450SYA4_9GAMM|nr:MAG: Holin of 3TMs, for gene-transfer release [Candidatus Kentron sp. DK]